MTNHYQNCTCAGCSPEKYRARKKGYLPPSPHTPMPEDKSCQSCGKTGPLYIDHDHATGQFRGWLCNKCNIGIGMLGDDIKILRAAVQYLEKTG